MEKSNKLELGSVQETLVIPLWVRAFETQKDKPLLIDNQAVSLVNSIPYDFTGFEQMSRSFFWRVIANGTIGRYIYCDNKLNAFIDSYPEATVVNIGCGLDTTFYRVDNGKIQWLDLDLPDVIDLRKEYFPEKERNRLISKSVFDTSWYDIIENKDNVMLLMVGVIYFFDESQIKRLFKDFQTYLPGAEMVFDVGSKLMAKTFNRKVKKEGRSARIIWSNSNIHKIERWNYGLEVIDSISAYNKNGRDYPFLHRIVMSVFETFKLLAMAHVKIHPPQDS